MVCTLGNKQQGSEARCVRLAPASADDSHHDDHADPKELKVEATKHFRIKKHTTFGAGGGTTTTLLSIARRNDRETQRREGEENDPAKAACWH